MVIIMAPNGLRGVELRHLVTFEAVARQRSFTGAARELACTQSAVSQQIAELERVARSRLFVRFAGPRPVELTEAGRVLLVHARALVARLEAVGVDLDALAEGAVGDLRIGTFQSAATRLLPKVLATFRSAWPGIEVTLFESGSHDEIDHQVERGALDIAFTHPPTPVGLPLEYADLLTDRYVVVVSREHPLATAGVLRSLDELNGIDLVGYRVCRANLEVERRLRAGGVEPRVVFRAEDNMMLQGLAAAGMGAAIMPILAIDPARTDVVVIEMGDLIPPRRIGLVWHRERHQTPAMQAFQRLARESAAELDASLVAH
jgi:DNA-binding transcriptional LysR family regulator